MIYYIILYVLNELAFFPGYKNIAALSLKTLKFLKIILK